MKLYTKDLVKFYGQKKVVDSVNIEVSAGEVVALLGPNGAGKTTTFYSIVGIIKPTSGEIFFNDKPVTKLPMYKRAKMGIGYLAQEPSIFRKLSAENNLRFVLEWTKKNKKQINETIDNLLEEFNITRVRKSLGYELSGGERRRVEIARSLATNPMLMLLDEPFTGIDPIAISEIQETIKHLKSKNIGVLITDHNVRDTLDIVDRAYIMYEGKILLSGNAKEIANDPTANKFYLGGKFTF